VVLCNRSFVLQPNTQIISVQDHSLKQQALCPLVHSMILALTVASEYTHDQIRSQVRVPTLTITHGIRRWDK